MRSKLVSSLILAGLLAVAGQAFAAQGTNAPAPQASEKAVTHETAAHQKHQIKHHVKHHAKHHMRHHTKAHKKAAEKTPTTKK